jgi:hypothetical protein
MPAANATKARAFADRHFSSIAGRERTIAEQTKHMASPRSFARRMTGLQRAMREKIEEIVDTGMQDPSLSGHQRYRLHVLYYGMVLYTARMFPAERCFSEAALAISQARYTGAAQTGGGLFQFQAWWRRSKNRPKHVSHLMQKLSVWADAVGFTTLTDVIDQYLSPATRPSPSAEVIDPLEHALCKIVRDVFDGRKFRNVSSIKRDLMKTIDENHRWKGRTYVPSPEEKHVPLTVVKCDDALNYVLARAAVKFSKKSNASLRGWQRVKEAAEKTGVVNVFHRGHAGSTQDVDQILSDIVMEKTIYVPIPTEEGQTGGSWDGPRKTIGKIAYFPVRVLGYAIMSVGSILLIALCLIGAVVGGTLAVMGFLAHVGLQMALPLSRLGP